MLILAFFPLPEVSDTTTIVKVANIPIIIILAIFLGP